MRKFVTSPRGLARRVANRKARYRQFIRRARRTPVPVAPFIRLAAEIAEKVDCKSCANCCKTMRVQLNGADVARLAVHFKMRVADFKEKYLIYDKKDRLYETNTRPCPFLRPDNLCGVYEVRPRGCRGYPFLHERQPLDYRLNWLVEHAESCPIIYNMLEVTVEKHAS